MALQCRYRWHGSDARIHLVAIRLVWLAMHCQLLFSYIQVSVKRLRWSNVIFQDCIFK